MKMIQIIKRLLLTTLLLAGCFYILMLCLENSSTVDISFIFFELHDISLDKILVGSFIVGGLAGLLSATGLLFTMRRKYRISLQQAKKELASDSV